MIYEEDGKTKWAPLNEMVQVPRKRAQANLEGQLMSRIAETVGLIRWYGGDSLFHWKKELRAFLDDYLIKTSKRTAIQKNKRIVKDLWFDAKEYQEIFDSFTVDAITDSYIHMDKKEFRQNERDFSKDSFSEMGIFLKLSNSSEGYVLNVYFGNELVDWFG